MTAFDVQWAAEVCAYCDPVFEAADVGFVRRGRPDADADGSIGAILWEADPAKFAARYPDSGVVESYGAEQWDGVGCIDFWVYVDAADKLCRLSVEGWNLPEVLIRSRGHGGSDGMSIAAVFAKVLGIQWPLPAASVHWA